MMDVKGGAISAKILGIITGIVTGIITFAIGIWDGYVNPNTCRK